MKHFLAVALTLVVLGDAHASGLRRLKKEEETNGEILTLDDEFRPSLSPSDSPSMVPSPAPSASPSFSPSKVAVQTISPAPSEHPSPLVVTYESFSGGEANGKTFRIEIKFDDSPRQNGWHLFKGFGSNKREVYAKDFGSIQTGGMHITTFENMSTGEYTFVIADIGANGIKSGKMSIYINDDTLLWERDGAFDFLAQYAFSV